MKHYTVFSKPLKAEITNQRLNVKEEGIIKWSKTHFLDPYRDSTKSLVNKFKLLGSVKIPFYGLLKVVLASVVILICWDIQGIDKDYKHKIDSSTGNITNLQCKDKRSTSLISGDLHPV